MFKDIFFSHSDNSSKEFSCSPNNWGHQHSKAKLLKVFKILSYIYLLCIWSCVHMYRRMGGWKIRVHSLSTVWVQKSAHSVSLTGTFACLATCWSCHSPFRYWFAISFLDDRSFLFKNIEGFSLPLPPSQLFTVRFIIQPLKPLRILFLDLFSLLGLYDRFVNFKWT